ncbi:MAG: hypothetical protein ABW223_03805 [Rariglobus sp.]
MKFPSLALVLFTLSALVVPAKAQTPADEKETPKSIRFYYIGFAGTGEGQDPAVKFLLKNGKKTVPMQITPNSFTETFDYTGPVPITLFQEKRTEKSVEREDIGQLTFPAEWKGAIFIVTRNPANPRLPFHFFPIEYWGPSVPDQHVRILNLCPYLLAAKVGTGQIAINARTTADLALPAVADVPVRLAVQRDDQWERILSTAIERPAQNKLMLLVVPRPDGTARALVVADLPEPAAAKEARANGVQVSQR